MAKTKIFPVIMSGGSGTRLRPLSTERTQAVPPRSARAKVDDRGNGAPPVRRAYVRPQGRRRRIPALHRHRRANAIAASSTSCSPPPASHPAAVVLEPEGATTAATAVLAALIAREIDPEAMVVLAPADHPGRRPAGAHRGNPGGDADCPRQRIVTFGIRPTGPATGYGYIRQAPSLPTASTRSRSSGKARPVHRRRLSRRKAAIAGTPASSTSRRKSCLRNSSANAPDIRDGTADRPARRPRG